MNQQGFDLAGLHLFDQLKNARKPVRSAGWTSRLQLDLG